MKCVGSSHAGPTKSPLPLSFSHSGPKWTDSSGLVWWPAKHLSQSCLREKGWFEGHRHVERQHLELQRWTGGPAADRSNVECAARMLVSSPCRHAGCMTTEHTKPHSCLTPCSAIHPYSSLLLCLFVFCCCYCMSKAFLWSNSSSSWPELPEYQQQDCDSTFDY